MSLTGASTTHLTPAELDELRNDHAAYSDRRLHRRHRGHRTRHHGHGWPTRHDEVDVRVEESNDERDGGWDVGGFERPW